jgi:hypothetical protein
VSRARPGAKGRPSPSCQLPCPFCPAHARALPFALPRPPRSSAARGRRPREPQPGGPGGAHGPRGAHVAALPRRGALLPHRALRAVQHLLGLGGRAVRRAEARAEAAQEARRGALRSCVVLMGRSRRGDSAWGQRSGWRREGPAVARAACHIGRRCGGCAVVYSRVPCFALRMCEPRTTGAWRLLAPPVALSRPLEGRKVR